MPALSFPTDPAGLPGAGRPALLELADGDTLNLRVGPVAKRLGDSTVRMLGYNGAIPSPTLKVHQGSEIIVHVTNQGDLDTTVQWHARSRVRLVYETVGSHVGVNGQIAGGMTVARM